ncbi:unnamed protein product [Linum tenue]|uniref:Uncharacterized protein n=1 Tax=Linum tenue TaxID=586396 RepID=A0AAV0P8C2_9ROSI|nr:unnamed protein product [Linum tenue]
MSRLWTLNPTRRRHVVAAIGSFMNLLMIYVSLGLELAQLIEEAHSNRRRTREPTDSNSTSSSEDEGEPTIPLNQMNTAMVEEEMSEITDEGVEATSRAKRKQATTVAADSVGGPAQKRKKRHSDERRGDFSTELREMRRLIKESVDTIARAMGESELYTTMRANLMNNLKKLEGLTTAQRVLACERLCENPRDLRCFYDMEDDEDRLILVLDVLEK